MFTASEWLAAVYQEVPKGYVVLWRNDTCGSIFLPIGKYEKADTEVIKCKATPDANIYFGLGVQAREQKGRGTEKSVCAVPGVWVDIDYGDKETPAGNQKQYPPKEIVEQALKDMPLQPSVVAKTGGGLHVYWLLDEPFLIEDDEDRDRFRKLTWGWQALVKRTLARLHPDRKKNPKAAYDVDSTGDLARVLRLPCGWMHKYDAAVEVSGEYAAPDEWDRYNICDLEEFSIEVELPTQKELLAVTTTVGNIILDPAAEPSVDLFSLLCDYDDDFKRVWDHHKLFASNSEYDMSLCARAVQANWPDQEVANLIIAHRRKYQPDKLEKVCRPGYIVAMIQKASSESKLHTSVQALNGVPDEEDLPSSEDGESSTTESEREKIISHLSNICGIRIHGITQFSRQDPIYSLVLADGDEIEIGGVKEILGNYTALRNAIFSHCKLLMKPVPRAAWPGICENISKIITLIDPLDGRTQVVIVDDAETYLSRVDSYTEDAKSEACVESAPIVIGGNVYINIAMFLKWLNLRGMDRWERKKLQNAMRAGGFVSTSIAYRNPETQVVRRRCYWMIDAGRVGIGVRVTTGDIGGPEDDLLGDTSFGFGNYDD